MSGKSIAFTIAIVASATLSIPVEDYQVVVTSLKEQLDREDPYKGMNARERGTLKNLLVASGGDTQKAAEDYILVTIRAQGNERFRDLLKDLGATRAQVSTAVTPKASTVLQTLQTQPTITE